MNEATPAATPPPATDRVGYFNRILQSRGASPFEAVPAGPPDLSDPAITERVVETGSELHRIVKEELGDRSELHDIVNEIVAQGDESLRVLRDGDEERLAADPVLTNSLEVIVKTDGSRPSFMIRDGDVARSTSPLGTWGSTLDSEADKLRAAIACVGRIDDPSSAQGFQGTGFLVQKNLIVTNRHVLQAIAEEQADGSWQLKPGIVIDFGHEHRGLASVNPRPLKRVIYTGDKAIIPTLLDHAKLDLALIELEPDGAAPGPTPLTVELAADWPAPETTMFIVGYPGAPRPGVDTTNLLEELFRSTFGFKRLAPGRVMTTQGQTQVAPWTVTHDATTLGGNSGSVVLRIGQETFAAGLHYGGDSSAPRQNWGHVLGKVLDTPGAGSDKTLRQHFADFGVDMKDSLE